MWEVLTGNPDTVRYALLGLLFVVTVRLRPWRVLSRLGRSRG